MAAVARKKILGLGSFERSRPRIRLADGSEQTGPCAVHDQLEQIEAAFSEVQVKPYSAPIRLAIVAGGSLALWAGLFWVAAQVGRMV